MEKSCETCAYGYAYVQGTSNREVYCNRSPYGYYPQFSISHWCEAYKPKEDKKMNEEMPSCKFTFKVQCSQTGEWIDMACGHKFGGKCTCGDEAEIKKNRKRELQIKLADLDIRYERVIKEMTGATPVATYDRLRLLAREILDIVNKLKELEEKED